MQQHAYVKNILDKKKCFKCKPCERNTKLHLCQQSIYQKSHLKMMRLTGVTFLFLKFDNLLNLDN